MHTQRSRLAAIVVATSACWLADAGAVGFGPAPQGAVLGQPLDFTVPLRLDSGETVAPECVTADVTAGDTRVAGSQVRARVEGGDGPSAVVRVTTFSVVDEPVVTVNVAVGCPARLSRRFVLLADPAPTTASAPIPLPVESLPAEPARAPAAAPPAEPRPPAPPVASAPQRAPAEAATAPTTRQSRPQRRVARPAAPPATTTASVPPAPTARLRLDAVEPSASAPAAIAAEAAASAAAVAAAAEAAASAASAAAARVVALEQAIAKLQAEASADREALRQLRQRAAVAGDLSDRWFIGLWLAVAALALLALWLGLRLRALQRERQQVWWNAAAGAGATQPATAAISTVAAAAEATTSAEATLSTLAPTTTRPGPLAPGVFTPEPAPEPPVPLSQRTQPMPPGWRGEDSEGSRDVSIEELIDLEQQAEFFIVLGQEDAAIDLLVEHLRSTGGGSPMPYLKLLEIYRRRGDREAYDRTRARFNHRFNAYAPDWDADALAHGRYLEDYPSIVARLQMAWASPLDAMAELESLLFRKARGELFDMPAYRDVLFLYSLARDLLDREPLESGNVDVLLPISDSAERTQPMSLEDSPDSTRGLSQLDDHPTVPVDLDLTQPVIPDSLFGEPTLPVPVRRRT